MRPSNSKPIQKSEEQHQKKLGPRFPLREPPPPRELRPRESLNEGSFDGGEKPRRRERSLEGGRGASKEGEEPRRRERSLDDGGGGARPGGRNLDGGREGGSHYRTSLHFSNAMIRGIRSRRLRQGQSKPKKKKEKEKEKKRYSKFKLE